MVARPKLRRAQTQAEAARPYAQRMERMLASLGAAVVGSPTRRSCWSAPAQDSVHLLVAVTADRGLAGAFNTQYRPHDPATGAPAGSEGKTVKILAVGRKGATYLQPRIRQPPRRRRLLRRPQAHRLRRRPGRGQPHHRHARRRRVRRLHPRLQPLPRSSPGAHRDAADPHRRCRRARRQRPPAAPLYEYEPDEETLLDQLLPQNLAIQIYRATAGKLPRASTARG